ncbi:toxin-antitoxin system YwqK family antitoxin [Streptomyces luteireticuli]|uniref:toxin-antitoxin system YwqK family antitoxin n=1 Tax=Streptomyces luteireticuli TaxID=173858 RepID=UPI003558F000
MTPVTEQAMRISGDQVHLDEYGRTCYEDALLTGEVEKHADNGQLVMLFSYADGVEHGPQRAWWPDGTKRIEGVTRMGAAVGEWRYWHANGHLSELVVLDEHGRVMTRRRWNAAGELTLDKAIRRSG